MGSEVQEAIKILEELESDSSVPRNVRNRIKNTIESLKEKTDLKIRVNKALYELDEIADDPNLEAYTRTQIWNIASLLEKVS